MKKIPIPAAIVMASVLAAGAFVVRLTADDEHDRDHAHHFEFKPDTLVLSRSVYTGSATTVTVGETLPLGCVATTIVLPTLAAPPAPSTTNVSVTCTKAVDNGEYPVLVGGVWDGHNVFNNNGADGSFGVTSPIFLDNLTTDGKLLDTLTIPSTMLVTSFSSKSELALNRSTDGKSITFVAYHGGPICPTGGAISPNQANLLDVSNSNTPGVCDPTNPVVGNDPSNPTVRTAYYRAVMEVDADGNMHLTDGNAYSGNNGRAAIKANWLYYLTGNDNNGNLSTKSETPVATGLTNTKVGVNLITSTGAELLVPGQTPPVPPNINMIGDFEINQAGYPAPDKAGKDNNFRGLTIHNNTMYVTKGSGGNGIDTVYQVGTAGVLPTGSTAQLEATKITILPGFTTALATNADVTFDYPFGIWFANDTTLYVGDEGDGMIPDAASSKSQAGLQKWSLVGGTWKLDYILKDGLDLGVPYGIANYPASLNPATDGLRNITGRVNHDGTVTIYAVTSTVSANGDQGADPNKLVKVTDVLKNVTLPSPGAGDADNDKDDSYEHFVTIRTAHVGEVLRGVSFAPADGDGGDDHGRDH
jgi:hypothetical protein